MRLLKKNDAGKSKLRLAAVICAALGWWGILYPELTLTSDTYRVICEDEQQYSEDGGFISGQNQENHGMTDDYRELLRAKSGQIRIRSRLYLAITDWLAGEEKAEADKDFDERVIHGDTKAVQK